MKPFNSIQRRFVFSISLFIALLLAAIATGTYSYFRHSTEKLILDQQLSTINALALNLDREITLTHNALINVAAIAPPGAVRTPEIIRKWLENRTGIRTLFNHSLSILDKNGTLIATIPPHPEIIGASFADREYFVRSRASQQPVISDPFITPLNNHPIIVMTAPLLAKDGTIDGWLCGGIELLGEGGLFGIVKQARFGSTGYAYLFAPDRTMIWHPDTTRILKKDVAPGANLLFDRALEGFEGSGETINSRGVHFLASFKRLQTTRWILAANYPVAEAYAPIHRFRNYYLLGMLLMLIAAISLGRALGFAITRPLTGFIGQINALNRPDADRSQRLDPQRNDEIGQLASAFNALLDEVQRHEAELQSALAHADAANQAKSLFLASMSHELRTPMNGVLGMLELIGESELNAGQREYIEMAQTSARNLLALLNDILDLSKIEAGKMTLERIRFDVRSLLSDTLHVFSLNAHEKGLSTDLEIDDRIPAALYGDPTRLRQILTNLLGNAIKFTTHGGITLSAVRAPTEECTDHARITFSVSDTGIGIPQEQQAAIFDVFTQADASTTRRFGGTGLGLAICCRLAALMQSRIEVDSTPERGSVFRFTIDFECAGTIDEAPAPDTEVPSGQPLNILLAEDNPINQKITQALLSKSGHTITLAENGEEALARVGATPFDLILMDIDMPRLDGFGATRAIRQRGIDVPIIALTAHAIPGFREKCLAAGMNDYLTKPIRGQDLRRRISSIQPRSETTCPMENHQTPETAPLDTDAALGMMDGDKDLLRMVIKIVQEQMTPDRDEIACALQEKDFARLKKACHRLKGSLGQIGAAAAQSACAALEAAAVAGDSAVIPGLFQTLESELQRLKPAIDDYLSKEPSGS